MKKKYEWVKKKGIGRKIIKKAFFSCYVEKK